MKKLHYDQMSFLFFLNLFDLSNIGVWETNLYGERESMLASSITAFTFCVNLVAIYIFRFRIFSALKLNLSIVIFFSITFFCLLLSPNAIYSLVELTKIINLFLVCIVFKRTLFENMYSVFFAFSFLFVVINYIFIIFFPELGIENDASNRLDTWKGALRFKTELAIWAGILFNIILASINKGTQRFTLKSIIILTLLFGLIIGSQSVTVLLSIFMLPLFLIFTKSISKIQAVYVRYMLAIVVISALMLFYTSLEYILFLFDRDLTFSSRSLIWEYLYLEIIDGPLFGFGIHGFWSNDYLTDSLYLYLGWGDFSSAHNSILEWFLSTGFLGGMYFIYIYLKYVFKFLFIREKCDAYFIVYRFTLPVVLIASISGSYLGNVNILWLFVFLTIIESNTNERVNRNSFI